jgi:hypothetical protein
MNKHLPLSRLDVVRKVRTSLDAGLVGTALLQQLDGLHPIEIKNSLINTGDQSIFKKAFDGISVSKPMFHEILREDNPSLSFWPFTASTISKITSRTRDFSCIGLLGVPSLFANLRSANQTAPTRATLFDCDDYFFAEGTEGFLKSDVAGISSKFDGMFDLVIADPPWYLDEYREWLSTAARIIRPGGTFMFVLFPKGIRPSAQAEREAILAFAESAFSEISIDDTKVHYETPSFEQVQLIRNGILPINWRVADLVVCKAGEKKKAHAAEGVRKFSIWHECKIGSGRFFIDPVAKNFHPDDDFLVCADTNSRFLQSPSRRTPGRAKANILSSRGHGLYCSDPNRFIRLANVVNCVSDIDQVANSIDPASRELFRLVMRDLWGRFIFL